MDIIMAIADPSLTLQSGPPSILTSEHLPTEKTVFIVGPHLRPLLDLDLRHIMRPRWKGKDFAYIKNVITYKSFRKEIQLVNPNYSIGRKEMEALWYRELRKCWRNWKVKWHDVEDPNVYDLIGRWMRKKMDETVKQVSIPQMGFPQQTKYAWRSDYRCLTICDTSRDLSPSGCLVVEMSHQS
jgi:hypothetical protein